jgi:DNA-directed RNA polymerase specialized sigma24 family protein
MCKRLAAFETFIQKTVSHFGANLGGDRDDCAALLRITTWHLLQTETAYPQAYIQSAIWNRARDVVKAKTRLRRRFRLGEIVEQATYEPWSMVDLRLDLQKVVDQMPEDEVQILWTVAQHGGRQDAQRELGLTRSTLHRKLSNARSRAGELLAA